MKQEQLFSVLRTVLTLAGALLTGGGMHFFGQTIDTPLWQEITGIVMAVISVVWSIYTKAVDLEKLQGTIRQVVTFVFGILAAKHLISDQTQNAVLALLAALIPILQAGMSRQKNKLIATGAISLDDLKGVAPPDGTPKKAAL
jgi:hypothetical protein